MRRKVEGEYMDWFPLYNSLRIAAIACTLVFFLGIFSAYYIARLPRVALFRARGMPISSRLMTALGGRSFSLSDPSPETIMSWAVRLFSRRSLGQRADGRLSTATGRCPRGWMCLRFPKSCLPMMRQLRTLSSTSLSVLNGTTSETIIRNVMS